MNSSNDVVRLRPPGEWNETRAEYRRDHFVQELFELQAQRTPDAPALVFRDQTWTYLDLERRASRVAHQLRGMAVGPERRVGVLMERSPELVAALLGVLKAGAAYVPLDPAYPRERLEFMVQDAGISVLLTTESQSRSAWQGPEVLCVDAPWPEASAPPLQAPGKGMAPENLAYVIYTSGSTGRPKGVAVSHASLMNLVDWHQSTYQVTAADRATLVAAPGFDASVWELWPYLAAGASLWIPEPRVRATPRELVSWLVANGITLCFLPTPLAEEVMLEKWPPGGSLRALLTGGDKLHRAAVDAPFTLVNHYGPTESTVVATCTPVEGKAGREEVPPIGRPISNITAYLLDNDFEPVAVGATGEMWIGGDGLARGYLNDPRLTSERFMPDPFGGTPGARLYRTGDLARWRPDGQIDFLGRSDDQIKIRGFRIEPGEIESVLSLHPELREAAVVAHQEASGQARLVAYVVPCREPSPSPAQLKAHTLEKLPDFMVPTSFVFLDTLPLTANGKVDRRALPAPPTRPETAFVAPRNSIEEALAKVLAQALKVSQIGVHDDLFDLGADSLLLTRTLPDLREALGMELSVETLFGHPTVAALAQATTGGKEIAENFPRMEPVSRDKNLPLSFSQQRVWFFQTMNPASLAYNFQATLRLVGPLDLPALRASLNEVVRRHEIFRTTFPAIDGEPVQVIHSPFPVELPVVDLGERSGDEATLVDEVLGEEFRRAFALDSLPLVRWLLVRFRSGQEHLLVHVEHHLVHDGWSFNVFLEELRELYRAFATGAPASLPPLKIQFADFAMSQREWMQGPVARRQLDYWRSTLAGSPQLLELPTDRPRPPVPSYRGNTLRLDLEEDLAQRLRSPDRGDNASLFMRMLAAFLILLERYSGQTDLVVGTAIANRRWPDTERLIGMIINMIALRTDVGGDPTFAQLLARVRQVTTGAYAHQDLPFDQVVETLAPARKASYHPIYQVTFSFHDAPMPSLDLPGLTVELVEGRANQTAKFDLNVIVIPRTGQRYIRGEVTRSAPMTLVWEYNTDLFDPSTMEQMVGHYQTILRCVLQDPDVRMSHIPLLSPQERALLAEWSALPEASPERRAYLDRLQETLEPELKVTGSVAPVLHNARLLLVDRHLNPVPVGVAGEILIAASGLEGAFFPTAALTAERLVPDPFALQAGGRLYRTGDLARYRHDASLEFLGRNEAKTEARPSPTPRQASDAELRERAQEEPRTAIERTIATVWREVLHLDRVGIHDDFFDLGGHSLLLMQVHRHLEERLGRELSVLDLWEHPSIAVLARYLAREGGDTAPAPQHDPLSTVTTGHPQRVKNRLAKLRGLADSK